MKRLALAMFVVLVSVVGLSGCDQVKKWFGTEETAPAQTAAPAVEAAADPVAAAEKAAEEAEKKIAEVPKIAEQAEKEALAAKEEMDKKLAEAQALQGKAAEAQAQAAQALAASDAEKARLAAEAEKAKAMANSAEAEKERVMQEAMKAKKEAVLKDLADIKKNTAELKIKLEEAAIKWEKVDADKARTIRGLADKVTAVDTKIADQVETPLRQEKVDEAEGAMKLIRAEFQPVQEAAAAALKDEPVDPVKWDAMLNILAEETCLKAKNPPQNEFEKQREALFTKYNLTREEYENVLRPKYTTSPKPEDQAKLGKMVEACSAPAVDPTTVVDDPTKITEETPTEEDKKGMYNGPWAGSISCSGTHALTFTLTGNRLSGKVVLKGKQIPVKGSIGNHSQFAGRLSNSNKDYVKCTGSRSKGSISGTCRASIDKKGLECTYTAKKK